MSIKLTVVVATLCLCSLQAFAQDGTDGKRLIESDPQTGTAIKREIATSTSLPFDKEWHELTKQQQLAVLAEYDSLPPNTEPPYPIGGIGVIYKPLANAYQRVTNVVRDGHIFVLAYIDTTGSPQKIEVYKGVTEEAFMSFVASTIMSTKFKPAVCNGKPCAMPFIVEAKLQRR